MPIVIEEETPESLAAYASISIAFRVTEILDLDAVAVDRPIRPRRTRPVQHPFAKDYDAQPGNSPLDWPTRFDVSEWGFLAAYSDGDRVGGAVVMARDRSIDLLEGRDDLALLWDLRVAPNFRRRGAASALLTAAEEWARARWSRLLKVETQDINVPACRFYERHAFTMRAVNKAAYAEFPNEIQLFWYKDLLKPLARSG